MSLTTPTADLKLTYTAGTTWDGVPCTIVDLAITPYGDLALVSGQARLQQDITRWLLTPQGSNPFDPTYGNPLFSLLARPANAQDSYLTMIEHAEDEFIAAQSVAVSQGYLSLDEQVDHFENTKVVLGGNQSPGVVVVSFDVVTKSNTNFSITAPFVLS